MSVSHPRIYFFAAVRLTFVLLVCPRSHGIFAKVNIIREGAFLLCHFLFLYRSVRAAVFCFVIFAAARSLPSTAC